MSDVLELKGLSPDEVNILLNVLRRDAELRAQEDQRLNGIRKEIYFIKKKAALKPEDRNKDISRLCTRCHSELGLVSNRGELCPKCHSKVCSNCQIPVSSKCKWLCTLCNKQRELAAQSGEWFYSKLRNNDKKVVILGSDVLKASLQKTGLLDEKELEGLSSSKSAPIDVKSSHSAEFPRERDTTRLISLISGRKTVNNNGTVTTFKRASSRRRRDSSSSEDEESLPTSTKGGRVPSSSGSDHYTITSTDEDLPNTRVSSNGYKSPDSAIVLSNESLDLHTTLPDKGPDETDMSHSKSESQMLEGVGRTIGNHSPYETQKRITTTITKKPDSLSSSDSEVEYTVEELSKIKFKRCSISANKLHTAEQTGKADEAVLPGELEDNRCGSPRDESDTDNICDHGHIGGAHMHVSHNLSGTQASPLYYGGGVVSENPLALHGLNEMSSTDRIDPSDRDSNLIVMQALDDETVDINILPAKIIAETYRQGPSNSFENPVFQSHMVFEDSGEVTDASTQKTYDTTDASKMSSSDESEEDQSFRNVSDKDIAFFNKIKAGLHPVKQTSQEEPDGIPTHHAIDDDIHKEASILDDESTGPSEYYELHQDPYTTEERTEFLDDQEEYYDDITGVGEMYVVQKPVFYGNQYGAPVGNMTADQVYHQQHYVEDGCSDSLSVITEVTEPPSDEEDSDSDVSLTIDNFPDLAQITELEQLMSPPTDFDEPLFKRRLSDKEQLPRKHLKKDDFVDNENMGKRDETTGSPMSSLSSTISEESEMNKSVIELDDNGEVVDLYDNLPSQEYPHLMEESNKETPILLRKNSARVIEDSLDVHKMKDFWAHQADLQPHYLRAQPVRHDDQNRHDSATGGIRQKVEHDDVGTDIAIRQDVRIDTYDLSSTHDRHSDQARQGDTQSPVIPVRHKRHTKQKTRDLTASSGSPVHSSTNKDGLKLNLSKTGDRDACFQDPISPLSASMTPLGEDSFKLLQAYKEHLQDDLDSSSTQERDGNFNHPDIPDIQSSRDPLYELIDIRPIKESVSDSLYKQQLVHASESTINPTKIESSNEPPYAVITKNRKDELPPNKTNESIILHKDNSNEPTYAVINKKRLKQPKNTDVNTTSHIIPEASIDVRSSYVHYEDVREPADGQSSHEVEGGDDESNPCYEPIDFLPKLPAKHSSNIDTTHTTLLITNQSNVTNQNISSGSSGLHSFATSSDNTTLPLVAPPRKKRRAPQMTEHTSLPKLAEAGESTENEDSYKELPAITVSQNPASTTTTPTVEVTHTDDQELVEDEMIDKFQDDENIDELFANQRLVTGSRTNLNQSYGGSSSSIASYYSDAGDVNYGKIPVTGEIQFGLEYDYSSCVLKIHVKQAKNIAAADAKKNRSDSYIKTYLLPDKTRSGKRKTKVKKNSLSPTFNEILKYAIDITELSVRTLWLSVWNSDVFGHNDFLGEVLVPFDNYIFSHDAIPQWYMLEERLQGPDQLLQYKGDLLLSIRYVSAGNVTSNKKKKKKDMSKGSLEVLVKEARNLTPMDSNALSDPFCKGYLLPDKSKGGKKKTDVVKKDCNPQWNHTLVFDGVDLEEIEERSLELTIWDHDSIGSNEFLGGVRLNTGTGFSFGRNVDWMDARADEISMWQKVASCPNAWVDGSLMLRANMENSQ